MARVGYYILTDAQADILTKLGIGFDFLGGKKCVHDWQSVIDQVEAEVYADDVVTDEEGEMLDTMYSQETYLYWSTEGHFWV